MRLGILFVSGAERDMRQCDQSSTYNSCDSDIDTVQSDALLWEAVVLRVPDTGLSPLGRQVKMNGYQALRRYFLAAAVFRTGNFGGYVSQLRQAITQGAAAMSRLDLLPTFNAYMALAGCALWQVELRIFGANPCS